MVNPKTLNTWMTNNKIFAEDGNFEWSYLNKFGFIYERNSTTTLTKSIIENYINGKVVVLNIASKDTYSVMTGFSQDSKGIYTFHVNDPKFGITSYSEYSVFWGYFFTKPSDCISSE